GSETSHVRLAGVTRWRGFGAAARQSCPQSRASASLRQSLPQWSQNRGPHLWEEKVASADKSEASNLSLDSDSGSTRQPNSRRSREEGRLPMSARFLFLTAFILAAAAGARAQLGFPGSPGSGISAPGG